MDGGYFRVLETGSPVDWLLLLLLLEPAVGIVGETAAEDEGFADVAG